MDQKQSIHDFVSYWEDYIDTATWKKMLKNKPFLSIQAWLKRDNFSFHEWKHYLYTLGSKQIFKRLPLLIAYFKCISVYSGYKKSKMKLKFQVFVL